ncbi:MAG: hypothetical protein R3F39_00295 [Myxococcota bacterium]
MPDEPSGAADRFLAPVIGSVLSIDWGGRPDQLVAAWPAARVVRDAEDVQTLIVPQVRLSEDVAAQAECTFTWEGLISVSLVPLAAGEAAFEALRGRVAGAFSAALVDGDLGYQTCLQDGTRLTIDRLDRVVRLEEAS